MKKILKFSNSENFLKCPICNEDLVLSKMSLYCTNKHCFDVSNSGYVNLTLNNRKQTYNKDSYLNRRAVFNTGYYSHILQEVINTLASINTVKTILDVGCGEGYYSREIYKKLRKEIIAFDISKDSIQMASKIDLSDSIKWFVGDLTQLPIKDNCIDCILDIFSPANYSEFRRVLVEAGYIIKVIRGNMHMVELRNIVSEYLRNQEYSNERIISLFKENCSFIYQKNVSASYEITNDKLQVFTKMTPLLFNMSMNHKKHEFVEIPSLTIEGEILLGKV